MPRTPLAAPSWRNRVKELRYCSPADLADHPLQWRVHPDQQRAALRGLLEDIGIAGALLAYESPATGQLVSIDGHLRKSLGPGPWPTLILDVTDEEAALLLATHDPLATLAQSDTAQLGALLQQVQSEDAAVQAFLAELAEEQHGELPTSGGPLPQPSEYWQGMPEFHQEDQLGYQTIHVHLGQAITSKTRYLWYPQQTPLVHDEVFASNESVLPSLHSLERTLGKSSHE